MLSYLPKNRFALILERIIRLSLKQKKLNLSNRFRGLLPVVVDVETTGLNPQTDGLLELAAVTIAMDPQGRLSPSQTYFYSIEPFQGANIDHKSLEITKINPQDPLRYAIPELQALHFLFAELQVAIRKAQTHRAVLVGHNAWFDLAFLQAAAKRCGFKETPFHSFTSFDTATLAGVALGETVLAKALRAARISFDVNQAHSAIYDAEKTAELFCYIVNQF